MLEEADVRAMVRLVGEVAGLPGGHAEKKRFLMQGISELIGADSWVWGLCVKLQEGKESIYTGVIHGGFTDQQFAKFIEATCQPEEGVLTKSMVDDILRQRRHITRTRAQIDPHDKFSSSSVYNTWVEAGAFPGLLSFRPVDERCLTQIGIYRRPFREHFTEREARIAHIILTEVPWLHELGWPEDRGVTVPRLAPRQRIVLNHLLNGQSRKQIADHMGISMNTVSGYVKEVYRHFGKQSHAELINHFMAGDGGDVL